jgi:hypothetical protein
VRCSPRLRIALVALLLVLLPAGSVAIARTHLLSAGPQEEPGAPDIGGLPQQPQQPHDPPTDLTPAALVDANARRIASGGEDSGQPLPDGYVATPAAGSTPLVSAPLTPVSTTPPPPSTTAAGPVATGIVATLPPRPGGSTSSPTPTPSSTPTITPVATASATTTATPQAGASTATATPQPGQPAAH